MNDRKPAIVSSVSVLATIFFKEGRLRPWLRVLAYVLSVVAAFEILSLFLLAGVAGLAFQPSATSFLVLEVFLSAFVVVGLALLFRRYVDGRPSASLGLAFRGSWLRLFALGLAFGAGMQTLAFALQLLFGHVQVVGFGPLGNDAKLITAAAIIFMVAALTEEMSVRGYVLQNLWEEWGFVPAVILSSLAFALLHTRNPHSHEQVWLTGGNFGPEAGLASIAALLAGGALLWLLRSRHVLNGNG